MAGNVKKKMMRRNIFSQSFTVCKVEEKKMSENNFLYIYWTYWRKIKCIYIIFCVSSGINEKKYIFEKKYSKSNQIKLDKILEK